MINGKQSNCSFFFIIIAIWILYSCLTDKKFFFLSNWIDENCSMHFTRRNTFWAVINYLFLKHKFRTFFFFFVLWHTSLLAQWLLGLIFFFSILKSISLISIIQYLQISKSPFTIVNKKLSIKIYITIIYFCWTIKQNNKKTKIMKRNNNNNKKQWNYTLQFWRLHLIYHIIETV